MFRYMSIDTSPKILLDSFSMVGLNILFQMLHTILPMNVVGTNNTDSDNQSLLSI